MLHFLDLKRVCSDGGNVLDHLQQSPVKYKTEYKMNVQTFVPVYGSKGRAGHGLSQTGWVRDVWTSPHTLPAHKLTVAA